MGFAKVSSIIQAGDMFDYVENLDEYTEADARSVMKNLLSALAYLHSIHVVHRDVKLENLLVTVIDGERVVKLCDFGLATFALEPLRIMCGTPTYVAPEVLQDSGWVQNIRIID